MLTYSLSPSLRTSHHQMLYIRRREAFRQRWRRPWDGDDGADFMDWIEHKTHPENVKVGTAPQSKDRN